MAKIIGKKCSKCLETIHQDSKKCKFCGTSSDIGDMGTLDQWGLIGSPLLILAGIFNICHWEHVGISILFILGGIGLICHAVKEYKSDYVYEDEEEKI